MTSLDFFTAYLTAFADKAKTDNTQQIALDDDRLPEIIATATALNQTGHRATVTTNPAAPDTALVEILGPNLPDPTFLNPRLTYHVKLDSQTRPAV